VASELFGGQGGRLGKNKISEDGKSSKPSDCICSAVHWRMMMIFRALMEITLIDKPELG